MLISLNWIKKFVDIKIADDDLIRLIGARLVEVEDAIDQTHKYDKIYAVKVVTAEKIPDTHLTLCKIDDGKRAVDVVRGDDGLVQVMCGAPNVRAGMLAAWIAPGAIVPSTANTPEPFKIGVRKMLKQYDSYGMMAGADELDFGTDHSGIVELNPATTKIGDNLADLFDLNDIVLDIENKSLTHRPDTFGIIGFAREVAGILDQPFKTPTWLLAENTTLKNASDVKMEIDIQDPELCPRYTALIMAPTATTAQPKYLSLQDTLLARSGMRPIDPIVDATNYMMLLTGQPLHAFDYDKFVSVGGSKTPKIIVRAAKTGEKMQLLDGKEIELVADDIVITSNDVPVALAGAMGSANTEIDTNTKRVILESATFSLYNLRKTQMAHGIFSEAITRFTKGQPAGQTLPVALETADLLQNRMTPIAMFDSRAVAANEIKVTLPLSQINELLGTTFSLDAVKRTLENVEFKIETKDDILTCTVPFWRTDIHIPEDIIEEIGRLTGFDNITPILPLHATAEPNEMFSLKTQLRNTLSSYGANETLTYSFIHGDLIKKVNQNTANSYRVVNSISPDLQYIRQSILPSLIEKSYGNLRAGHDRFVLFEMNQVYPRALGFDEDQVPQGTYQLACFAVDATESTKYYLAKKYLEQTLARLGVQFMLEPFALATDASNAYFEPQRAANIVVSGQVIGYLGECKATILREFKLPLGAAGFEIDLKALLQFTGNYDKSFRYSQYPSVLRDITYDVDVSHSYAELLQNINRVLAKQGLVYTVRPVSIYQAQGANIKNVSFHISFAHPDKTLTKREIQDIIDKLEQVK